LVDSQTQNTTHILQRAHQELTQTRENNQKAAQILSETLKELGVEE
jgi:hypothetical protein